MLNVNKRQRKTVQVQYTIQDGEYEYGDSFVMQGDDERMEEQAFQELAGHFACDPEEEQDIIAALKSEGQAMIGDRVIKNVFIKATTPVLVIVRGGVIQDIQNIPEGITFEVQDYDVDGLTVEELESLEQDEDGVPYNVSIWKNS